MNELDPRVKRTRKLLRDAVVELLAEKSFHAINVQEVADRATVNRATFYAHFVDKFALLDYVVGEWFHDELLGAGLVTAPYSESSLRRLVTTVMKFMTHFHSSCRPADRDLEPMLETKLQSELAIFLDGWLGERAGAEPGPAAKLVSWAIFGSAMDWAGTGGTEPMDDRVDQIVSFVLRGLGALNPH